jgi:membrane-associated protease RseP (regulator of RpoE activity)
MSDLELFILAANSAWLSLFVHELGHLLTARYFGVRVLTVSVGIGPEIVGFSDRWGTRWSVAAIPLGSRTKTVDEKPWLSPFAKSPELLSKESLSSRSRLERAAIYSAGAAANILLAPAMYALVQLLLRGALLRGALTWPIAGDPASAAALSVGLYSLSIGLLSLLPLPSFDGAKLLQLGVEWFREGNIVSPKPAARRLKGPAVGRRRISSWLGFFS